MLRVMSRTAAVVLVASSIACSRSDAEPRPEPTTASSTPQNKPVASSSASASSPAARAPSATSSAAAPSVPLVLAHGLRMIHAADGADAARVVREAREREAADGRDLVVYVGATWCEPCQRFHKAAAAGALDADFPRLTVLEFDLDEDRDRLASAAYSSQYIPLFVMPGADGRGTNKRFEGAVKGERAVANIAPRLRAILARDDVH